MDKAARYLIDVAGLVRPPVDIERLARMQGVWEIQREPVSGADAKLTPVDGGYVIKVDPGASRTRSRFSIAHEVAHTFFKHNHDSYRNQTVTLANGTAQGAYRLEEQLCDRAAAEMLMPTEMFVSEVRARGPSVDLFKHLSDTFETSLKATFIRYTELFDFRAQITMWRGRGNELRGNWTRGTTVLEARVLSPDEPGDRIEAAIIDAYGTDSHIKRWVSDGVRKVRVDAKAFGSGDDRYVLSVLQSALD